MFRSAMMILVLLLAGCASPTAFTGKPVPSVEFDRMIARHDSAAWAKRVDQMDVRHDSFMVQLANVNKYFNYFNYRPETATDVWLTPAEFMSTRGDCEDYAIAKYLTLKALGVADDDMRITVFPDPLGKSDHVVLVVRHGGKEFVLDYRRDSRIYQLGRGASRTVNADGWRKL